MAELGGTGHLWEEAAATAGQGASWVASRAALGPRATPGQLTRGRQSGQWDRPPEMQTGSILPSPQSDPSTPTCPIRGCSSGGPLLHRCFRAARSGFPWTRGHRDSGDAEISAAVGRMFPPAWGA